MLHKNEGVDLVVQLIFLVVWLSVCWICSLLSTVWQYQRDGVSVQVGRTDVLHYGAYNKDVVTQLRSQLEACVWVWWFMVPWSEQEVVVVVVYSAWMIQERDLNSTSPQPWYHGWPQSITLTRHYPHVEATSRHHVGVWHVPPTIFTKQMFHVSLILTLSSKLCIEHTSCSKYNPSCQEGC